MKRKLLILMAGFFLLTLPIFAQETDGEIQVLEDGTRYLIHPSKLLRGGPPPDGIPSVDNPRYISVCEADSWLSDDELVVLIERNGVTRIYPLQVLVWHEIVNDTIANEPILVTYCPLCGSVIAFVREINGEAVEFGTSGKLYNSNLIMYDRMTETYWSQIGGRAVIGELTGHRLELVPAQTVFWGEWKELRPDAEVLSRDTGFRRSYGRDPYGNYYNEDWLMFPVERLDRRIGPKSVVFGIEIDGQYKAYRAEAITREFSDRFAGRSLDIEIGSGNSVRIIDSASGREIPFERDFWFAWAAFHPTTELWEG